MKNTLCAVVLAAGMGKRMKTEKPKVMCEVLFKPMVSWVCDTLLEAQVEQVCVVCAADNDMVQQHVQGRAAIALQKERLGTGHAVNCAREFIQAAAAQHVLVLCGDAPFVDVQTLQKAYAQHIEKQAALTVVSASLQNPTGYGRIVAQNGVLERIVEQKDANAEERAICEVNSGILLFQKQALLWALDHLTNQNAQKEYYLTQSVQLLRQQNKPVYVYQSANPDVVLGANDKKALCELNELARKRVIEKHLQNGVEMVCTDGIIIGADVRIGEDACILPGSILKGKTVVGKCAKIGPNSELEDAIIGDCAQIRQSVVTRSRVGENAKIGPFSQIRPDCNIGPGVKIGDFVEVKNSTIGEKTSVAHLTYIGDSDVGAGVNFGCGCVTVNYDGVKKYRTTIGNNAFIGCNTNLVAPVKVGDGAYTAAGSTITRDVPEGAMAIGRVRQENKKDWARVKLSSKKK